MFQLLHGYCLFVGHSDMSQWFLDKKADKEAEFNQTREILILGLRGFNLCSSAVILSDQ